MKVTVILNERASAPAWNVGHVLELEVEAHPREQLASAACIVGRLEDREEVVIPFTSILLVRVEAADDRGTKRPR